MPSEINQAPIFPQSTVAERKRFGFRCCLGFSTLLLGRRHLAPDLLFRCLRAGRAAVLQEVNELLAQLHSCSRLRDLPDVLSCWEDLAVLRPLDRRIDVAYQLNEARWGGWLGKVGWSPAKGEESGPPTPKAFFKSKRRSTRLLALNLEEGEGKLEMFLLWVARDCHAVRDLLDIS